MRKWRWLLFQEETSDEVLEKGRFLADLLRKMPLVPGSYSLVLSLISLAAELDSSLQI